MKGHFWVLIYLFIFLWDKTSGFFFFEVFDFRGLVDNADMPVKGVTTDEGKEREQGAAHRVRGRTAIGGSSCSWATPAPMCGFWDHIHKLSCSHCTLCRHITQPFYSSGEPGPYKTFLHRQIYHWIHFLPILRQDLKFPLQNWDTVWCSVKTSASQIIQQSLGDKPVSKPSEKTWPHLLQLEPCAFRLFACVRRGWKTKCWHCIQSVKTCS